jgi:hypothetical protein
MAAAVLVAVPVTAHDFERTQVTLIFARDGSFVLDVTNDAAWLTHRLVPFVERGSPSFLDRVVLFVDGREVRPDSVEYVDGPAPLGIYRMRGRMPIDARTLRWYYGLPLDPYPLMISRADGRVVVEEIAGDAWSGTIDLSGQFHAPILSSTMVGIALLVLLAVPIALRIGSARTKDTKGTEDTEAKRLTSDAADGRPA